MKVKSLAQVRKEKNLPLRASMEDLAAAGLVVWEKWEPAHSTTPDGKESEGVYLTWYKNGNADGFNGEPQRFGTFVGATVLVKTAIEIDEPFEAAIVKKGRTWMFEDDVDSAASTDPDPGSFAAESSEPARNGRSRR